MMPDREQLGTTPAKAEDSPSNSHAGPWGTPHQQISRGYTRNFTKLLRGSQASPYRRRLRLVTKRYDAARPVRGRASNNESRSNSVRKNGRRRPARQQPA